MSDNDYTHEFITNDDGVIEDVVFVQHRELERNTNRNTFLFKVGNVTYGLIANGVAQARAYMRHVQRVRPEQYDYLGVDQRSHKEQWESQTIGVIVPVDWRPPIVPKSALEDEWLGEYVRFSLLGELIIGKVVAASEKDKTLTVEFMYDSAVVRVVDSYWHFTKREQEW